MAISADDVPSAALWLASPPSRLRRYGGQPPSGLVNRSVQLDDPPLDKNRKGWLANRSSLVNAGERRLVAQICPRWNRLQPWFELVGAFKEPHNPPAQRFTLF
jgi:hypothetical protein